METLQLKVFRNILRIHTTYIDRENNNQSIFDRTNLAMREQNTRKQNEKNVVPFVEAYNKLKSAESLVNLTV